MADQSCFSACPFNSTLINGVCGCQSNGQAIFSSGCHWYKRVSSSVGYLRRKVFCSNLNDDAEDCNGCPAGYSDFLGACEKTELLNYFAVFIAMFFVTLIYMVIQIVFRFIDELKGVLEPYYLIWTPVLLVLTFLTGLSWL